MRKIRLFALVFVLAICLCGCQSKRTDNRQESEERIIDESVSKENEEKPGKNDSVIGSPEDPISEQEKSEMLDVPVEGSLSEKEESKGKALSDEEPISDKTGNPDVAADSDSIQDEGSLSKVSSMEEQMTTAPIPESEVGFSSPWEGEEDTDF